MIIEVLCQQIYTDLEIIIIHENSHVIPGLIYRFHQAKIQNLSECYLFGEQVIPKREFLYVDDMVRASVHIMNIDKKIYEEQ